MERGFTDGSRNQAIWLDDVQCQGSETRLIDCPANALGSHNCGHSEDAGVRCQVSCTQGDIRLQGGNDTHGRVEICNDNVWGTVCDDLWNNADAIVACRQLGFDSGGMKVALVIVIHCAHTPLLSHLRACLLLSSLLISARLIKSSASNLTLISA